MKLNKIIIENFLSIEHAEIDFEEGTPIVRILGVNKDTKPHSSNGAGKSAIIEAVSFGLFGKTIRKTSEKSLKNVYTKGKCQVTLTLNDNVVIRRVKKPPMLQIEVDGINHTKDSIMSTQKYLETVLNINQHVFLASMVFGQSNKTNFITSSPEEKRSIIQTFLSINDLFEMRASIRSSKAKCNAEKKVATALCDESLNDVDKRMSN